MRIRFGCEWIYDLPQPTPMIALLNVHQTRAAQLEGPDVLVTDPAVRVESYRDIFGNWCSRFVAPAGGFTLSVDGVIADDGSADPVEPDTPQLAVEDLPSETLLYLLASRYCESDVLSNEAWTLFEHTQPGWPRVQAISDFVHDRLTFGYEHSRPTRTAAEAYREKVGVCRDFTHLAVAFCRAMNIPARYCTGYLSDIGEEPPYAPMDFAAWMEVYLGGKWWVFDPRNNAPRTGRILIAQGRDAADVPLIHSFGDNMLMSFRVWCDELPAGTFD